MDYDNKQELAELNICGNSEGEKYSGRNSLLMLYMYALNLSLRSSYLARLHAQQSAVSMIDRVG